MVRLSGPESFLYGAITVTTFIVTGKDTILTADNRRTQITFAIRINHSLTVNNFPRFGTQFLPDYGKDFLKLFHFFQFYRCSGITFYATFSLTGIQIAEKFLTQDVKTHHYIIYLYHILFVIG